MKDWPRLVCLVMLGVLVGIRFGAALERRVEAAPIICELAADPLDLDHYLGSHTGELHQPHSEPAGEVPRGPDYRMKMRCTNFPNECFTQ